MSDYLPALATARKLVASRTSSLIAIEADFIRGETAPAEQGIILALEDGRSYYVTQELERFDRELRRTVAYARKGLIPLEEALAESVAARSWETGQRADLLTVERRHTPDSSPENRPPTGERPPELRSSLQGARPDHPTASSTRLVAAAPGSSLLLLAPLGALISVLVSDPVTAVANAAAWSGSIARLRVWLNRSEDPLHGISARQVLDIYAEFGGHSESILGPPDQAINFGGPEVHLPDGTVLKSPRRIIVFRKEVDGSTSLFELD